MMHKNKYERMSDATYAYRQACATYPELNIAGCLSSTSKIGPAEHVKTFNLPLESTCCEAVNRIASPVCQAHCYCYKMMEWPSVKARAKKNFELTKLGGFSRIMIGALIDAAPTHMKLHAMGDFFSAAYIEAWTQVMVECDHVSFWCYSRAWRVQKFVPALAVLAALPNNNMLLSYDRATGLPPAIPNTQLAWLADTDAEVPPSKSKVVFRVSSERNAVPLTVLGDSVVCPHQNGRPGGPSDCVTCRICL